ncbi:MULTISPECIES: ABC transporter permease DevC [Cyanophyceae]|uniref:ABC transporter permease DevC n=1 Tax=Cyanophyceae TaxID=3028117 RepID=UPI00232B33EF|nr:MULTISPECIES: ABC transporter permease DevC [Cyanophyceae]MDB9357410.1 ABC transporter permease DevC [Nodularia spumigena CS-587/03]MDB9340211.1 ABC transporter permease DevC [Nodularia spumigena CS-589/07]MDB9400264.1 ABC transporter permease DevC [Microcystis aeruginosa CS-567/02-A1]MDB9499382.1 ABC transporter permease DevC [Nodularia spumigena CS-336/02]MDB9532820.1 ABC transporter permease DevC [Nodularia spumigena CS-1038]
MFKRKIPLAWRQLMKQKGRFIVALCGITFADFLMLMQLGFQSALYDSNTRFHELLQADVVLVSRQAQNLGLLSSFPRRRLFQAANLSEVESVNPLYVRLGVWKSPQTKLDESILVIGFNPEKPAFNLPAINQKLEQIKYPNTLLFDRNSNGKYAQAIAQISEGQSVTTELQGRKVKIGGLYEVGASFVANGSVITSDQNYLRIFSGQQPGQVNLGLINLKPGSNVDVVAKALQSYLNDDVQVFTRQEFIDFEKKYWQENGAIGFIFSLGVAIGFLVGVIVVYQIIYSDVMDHLPEYATLKAMGYRNSYLLLVVFQEALILAICGFIPGGFVSFVMYAFTRNVTKLPLFMTPDRIILVLILTIIMCLISGAIAMRKLNSADPADIF